MYHLFYSFIIFKVFDLLDRKEVKSGYMVLMMTLVGAIIDILGLSLILPVIAISSVPKEILNNAILHAIYDQFSFNSIDQFLISVYAFLLLVFVIRGLIFLYIKYMIANFSFGLARSYSVKLFKVYLGKPLDFFQNNSSADLLRDVYVSGQQFASYVILPLVQTISELFILVIILGGLLIYNIQVFVLLIVVLTPVTVLFYLFTKSKMEEIGKDIYTLNGQIINKVSQAISGYVDVKLSGRDSYFVNRFDQDQKSYAKMNVIKTVLSDVFPKVIEFTAVLGIVVIFIYALFFMEKEQNSFIILLGLFGASAYRILPSINRIMSGVLLIKQYGYLIEIMKLTKNYEDAKFIAKIPTKFFDFNHSIRMSHAKFVYSGKAHFNVEVPELVINKGEKLGIIGKSGSGKTTLVNLLLGFYPLNDGEISVDGIKLNSENWAEWKMNFGYVQQNVFISNVSLKENVAFGVDDDEIDDKRVVECLKTALMGEFVDTLENGIESILGDNGANISGGQKQRLAIARSLYFNRQILVFDEATSALDNETEKEITDSIKSLSKGNITMIIIAHRYGTLKYCDRIIEMDGGKIVKEVEYDELLNRE